LPPLRLHQIVFFDECHKKCEIGRTVLTAYSFPRDEDGLYSKDGDIADFATKLDEKYTREGRFSFGVTAVKLQDGTVEGRRTRTFDYSAKNLVTITAETNMIRDEIRRVRSLKSVGQWIEMRQSLPGVIFEEDDVTVMNDIADTRKGHFARHGINTVLDVKLMNETEISVILTDKAFRVS
jgi:hypothetical protein